jgi:hypothetical protein
MGGRDLAWLWRGPAPLLHLGRARPGFNWVIGRWFGIERFFPSGIRGLVGARGLVSKSLG